MRLNEQSTICRLTWTGLKLGRSRSHKTPIWRNPSVDMVEEKEVVIQGDIWPMFRVRPKNDAAIWTAPR